MGERMKIVKRNTEPKHVMHYAGTILLAIRTTVALPYMWKR